MTRVTSQKLYEVVSIMLNAAIQAATKSNLHRPARSPHSATHPTVGGSAIEQHESPHSAKDATGIR